MTRLSAEERRRRVAALRRRQAGETPGPEPPEPPDPEPPDPEPEPPDEGEPNGAALSSMTRTELNDRAAELGVDDPADLPNKDAVIAAIREAGG